MKRLALVLALVCALPAGGATLTFEQALARATAAHGLRDMPEDALRLLEHPGAFEWPSLRAEGAVSNARNIDIFNENVVHSRFVSAIVSVDYPLFDGGASALRRRAGALDAASFRDRTRELEEEIFTDVVDAVARLYSAQERRRILQHGLSRALGMRERAGELLTVREISGVTAAQWQDEAIAAESELIDLDLQRLDAETRLKQLIGDTTSDPIEITLTLDAPPSTQQPSNPATRANTLAEQRQLALDEARAARKPQLLLSGFGGVASLPDDRFALYGLRMTIALPMFDAAMRRREAQAQLEAAEAERERTAALERMRRQDAQTSLNIAALTKRIELLTRGAEVAKQRAESVARLTSAGLRSEAALAGALADAGRRESELLAARVELWRQTLLARR